MSAESFLAELRSDFHSSGRLLRALTEGETFSPRAGSRAEAEWTNSAATDIHETYSSADLLIGCASDYLEAVARILVEEVPERSVLLLCRGISETSARAWWLLDPDVSPHERARRGLLERLNNVIEISALTKASQPKEATSGVATADEGGAPSEKAIVADARARGYEVVKKRNAYAINGEARPSATKLLKLYNEESGEFAYKFLSASAHATTYALVHGMDTQAPVGEWEGGLVLRPNDDFATMATMLNVSCSLFYEAVDRKLLLFGRPLEEWRSWTRYALGRLARHLP